MIDKNKTYKTRDGREVRIYATDGESIYQVHGAYCSSYGGWRYMVWTSDGKHYDFDSPSQLDLIEVRPRIKRECWVNVYKTHCGQVHDTREEADKYGRGRIACLKFEIDCEEGEGL